MNQRKKRAITTSKTFTGFFAIISGAVALIAGGLKGYSQDYIILGAIAFNWNCVDFEDKKIKELRAITQVPRFDAEANVISRKTVLSDTKTACSVRTISITDIVVKTLEVWKEKQKQLSDEEFDPKGC